jgi:phosphoglycolate phosphatase
MSRLAVFDCDGTLVDSQAAIVAIMAQAFCAEGLPAPVDVEVRRTIGLPLLNAVALLAPAAEEAAHRRLTQAYRDIARSVQHADGHHEPLYDGAQATLDRLGAGGWLLAVATGKGRRGLIATLTRHGLLDRFLSLHTADDGPGKPDPAMLHSAMAAAGVDAASTVMIGDTSFDMRMAVNAGTRGIGVGWGYHPAGELLAAGAETVVATYVDLGDLLLGGRR